MSLRLIYGKIGSGKTSFCIKEALASGKRIYFITPEQFTFTAEKRICDLVNVHGLGGVEVLSLKRLASRFLSETEGAALPRLDGRTKTILLHKILVDNDSKLTVLKGLSKEQGIASTLGKLFSEMKRYNITAEALREAATKLVHIEKKLLDIALLFEAYEKTVKQKFLDRDDDLYRFARLLQESELFGDSEIYLDKFDGFDASEFAVIEALLRSGIRVSVTLCFHPQDEMLSAFTLHSQMKKRLLAIASASGAKVEAPVILEHVRPANGELLFLEDAYFKYPSSVYGDTPKCLSLVCAENPLGEIHNVARQILYLCRQKGYLYRDIAITARNTDMYARYIEAVLPSYGIPFFMDRTINILEHPFTVFVLSALEILTKGFSYETMFRYIKSGFLRIRTADIDVLENYVLATGIRGDIWKNEEKWNVRASMYAAKDTDEETTFLCIADKTRRQIVAPLLRLEEGLKKGKTAAEKCEALYSFLEEMKVSRRISALARLFEKNGDFVTAAEYRGVYNDFVDALDGVCDAFGEENISIRRLLIVLRTALGEVETGIIPSAQDGVSIGSINRIKGYAVKALFVIGTQDGVFPAPPEKSGILTDMERSLLLDLGLELASAESKTLFEEEHLIYKCITIPSELLEFSYPAASMEGNTQRPSRIYQRVQQLFPKISEKNLLLGISTLDKISVPDITLQHLLHDLKNGCADNTMLSVYGWFSKNYPEKIKDTFHALQYTNQAKRLSKETIHAYLGRELSSSVSRLEKLAACPFAYYSTYILGAKERKIMQPGAADAGRFLHDFLDVFSRRLRENGMVWQDVDDAYIEQEFSEIVPLLDRRLNTYMLENSPRYAHLFVRLRSAVRSGIQMLVKHMKICAFEPLGYELSFGEGGDLKPLSFTLPGGGKVTLSGRIDRAEALALPEKQGTLVRIIDYKSGSKTFELDDVYRGLNLQLAVYISALCTPENAFVIGENAKPAGMLYFRLVDPVVEASPMENNEVIENLRAKKFKLQGLVLSDETVLREMDSDIGKSSAILPARITATGVSGSIASEKQFETLSAYVKKTVQKLLSTLAEGNIDIAPYRKATNSACDFCKFSAFCAHDGSGFRNFDKQSAQEIWKEMEAEA